MMKFYKKSVFILMLFMFCSTLSAQTDNIEIVGQKYVEEGIEYTYTFKTDIPEDTNWSWYAFGGAEVTEQLKDSSDVVIGIKVIWSKLDASSSNEQVMEIEAYGTSNSVPIQNYSSNVFYASFKPDPNGIYPVILTDNENYIKTTTYHVDVKPDVNGNINSTNGNVDISYIDGIGRPLQNIAVSAGGEYEDIITPITYDEFGRKIRDYLPYAVSSNLGAIRTNPIQEVHDFYNTSKYENTINPYSNTILENTAQSRVLEQGAPGNDWIVDSKVNYYDVIKNKSIKFLYTLNADHQNIKLFEVSFLNDNKSDPKLEDMGVYGDNELYQTDTKDENWVHGSNSHSTQEFKNERGQVILKRTFNDVDINNDGDVDDANEKAVNHDTYYVYDIYGNLTYVIPPKVNTSDGVSTVELSELCYQYKYDNRNRLIEKKIPGKEWEYIVYDKLDRPILTQDYNLRYNTNLTQRNKWLFTKYDVFGRVVYTGIYTHASLLSQAQMQSHLDAFYDNDSELNIYESKLNIENNNHYYSNQSFPNTNIEVLTVNYYDDYTFTLPPSITKPSFVWETGDVAINVQDLATGSKIKVLDTNQWITSVTVYNKKARPIWLASYNEYLLTTDIVKNKLNFIGNPTKVVSIHKKQNQEDIVITDTYEYDHMQRLINQYQSITDFEPTTNSNVILTEPSSALHLSINSITLNPGFIGTPGFSAKISDPDNLKKELIVVNTYDELGQLESKKVGGVVDNNLSPKLQLGLQTIDYAYNIRGWLKSINDNISTDNTLTLANNDLFGFKINYNTVNHSGTKLYNGNISEIEWQTANTDNSLKWYQYDYDALNRITSATGNTSNYNLNSVAYDKNGNITSLIRHGQTNAGATSFGIMDDLVYSYEISSNKLKKVLDNGNGTYGFKDGSNTTTEYTYDDNGNMLTDANKGISTNITYNHLNLPTQVVLGGGNISYIYDASGAKLEKVVTEGSSMTKTKYAGNYVYEDSGTGDFLKFFNHEEGYIEPILDAGSIVYQYIYQYKDHLGNVRLSYKDSDNNGSVASSEILEENNYYPFGLKHKGYNSNVTSSNIALKRKYNGVELEEALGLNLYEMDVRSYDPAIARFTSIDPVTHYSMSTYTAFDNNPVFWADPSGANAQTTRVQDLNGKWHTLTEGADYTTVYSSDNSDTNDEDDNSEDNSSEEDCCGDGITGLLKGIAQGLIDTSIATNPLYKGIDDLSKLITGEGIIPEIEFTEGERTTYYTGIILFALLEPSPGGEIQLINKGVTGFAKHAINRAINRSVKPAAILDAIKNPLKILPSKTDDLGRESQRIIGAKAEIVINAEGKIISVNPTSTKKAQKLLQQQ
ncbi:DUF6443 domain-containing protein [Flavivirga abyssicola]|uniref:DUF6443 domain-containing protein n=1 Tax=Flavivirga abyssicola TaxID=3063533 RepID=UPI0026DFD7F6|nr:DUF6443 domain-containing protein [Flavivirga sp. MEBiC07777]WVK12607.1 DUF6443 domain-containing protein [Flavivirga sp. MEBiC07777]